MINKSQKNYQPSTINKYKWVDKKNNPQIIFFQIKIIKNNKQMRIIKKNNQNQMKKNKKKYQSQMKIN